MKYYSVLKKVEVLARAPAAVAGTAKLLRVVNMLNDNAVGLVTLFRSQRFCRVPRLFALTCVVLRGKKKLERRFTISN